MLELFLPNGIIGSVFFIFWLVTFPEVVYETMTFKDGDILWGLGTWLFFTLFVSTIVLAIYAALSHVII